MHVLVVGGTGMLKGATLWLAGEGHTVTLVARRPEKLGDMTRINPLALDYRNDAALAEALQGAIERFGPIGLAVCWIHGAKAPTALDTVAQALARAGSPFRLIHVRGSAAAQPDTPPGPGLAEPPAPCRYQQVVLGWQETETGTRWLTHPEISSGVINAIQADTAQTEIGVVRPWHRRPSY